LFVTAAEIQRQKSLPGSLTLAKARQQSGAVRAAAVEGVDRIAEGRAAAEAAKREAEVARSSSLGVIVEKYLAAAEKRLRPAS
jgi:hypothetical protein